MYFHATAKGLSISSKLKNFFLFFVIIKTFDQVCFLHSAFLIQFIFWIKILGWKVIDRNVISIPKAPAQPITVSLNLLDCMPNAEQI